MKNWMHLFKKLSRDKRGIAYLEFAVCAPFLIAMILGTIELTRYVLIVQKVEKTSMTLSDVVAQSKTMSTAQLGVIITATGQVLRPYTFGANSYVIITSVKKTGTNPPRVNWQYTGGGTWTHPSSIGTPGSDATLPAGMTLADKDNIIIAEVFYNFAAITTRSIVPNQTIYKVAYFKPRLGDLSTLSAIMPLFWKGTFV